MEELKLQDPFQNPEHTIDNADSGSESFDEDGHDRIQAQLIELQGQQEAIQKALARIQHGTYGICEVTGKEIPKERLFAIPTATTIVGV